MKYSPSNPISPLTKELNSQLGFFRKERNFSCELYLKNKLFLIKDYFNYCKLDTAIVALSGGLDSSLVLAILNYSKEKQGVPKNIIPITLPAKTRGVSNQKETLNKSKELCEFLKLELITQEVQETSNNIANELENNLNLSASDWARGQLVPYTRTPYLYYLSTLLSDNNKKAVIVGTTNKDEGAYLGYIGKASDAMVDIQLISDIHKSEVIKLSKFLNLPKSILEQIPNGDMYDNRSDIEVFGASYDFVELFLLQKENDSKFYENLKGESLEQWNYGCKNLEELHNYNKHKYLGCSPSVHLDVINYNFPKEMSYWKNSCTIKLEDNAIDFNKIVNLKQIKTEVLLNKDVKFENNQKYDYFHSALNEKCINSLKNELNSHNWEIAGNDGYISTKTEYGSKRISFLSNKFSKELYNSLKNKVNNYLKDEEGLWELIGVSNLFRVIKYEEGDYLLPHYDYPYIYNKNKKTFKSVVIVLEESEIGGEIIFVKENNTKNDWCRVSNMEEQEFSLKMKIGDIIIFNHDELHESSFIEKGTKIIIRTDLIYDKKNNYK